MFLRRPLRSESLSDELELHAVRNQPDFIAPTMQLLRHARDQLPSIRQAVFVQLRPGDRSLGQSHHRTKKKRGS